jgi:hypothetical protein
MKKQIVILLLLILSMHSLMSQQPEKISPARVNEPIRSGAREYLSLSGKWDFQLDREIVGEK